MLSETDRDLCIDQEAAKFMESDDDMSEDDAYTLATVSIDSYSAAYDEHYPKAFKKRRSELIRALVADGMDVEEAGESAKDEAEEYAKATAKESATEVSDAAVEAARKVLG